MKAVYRGVISDQYNPYFSAIAVRQLDDPLGDYGEYSIPSGERAGTRSAGTGDLAPVFLATGVRMTVDTRVTRPGQKRFGGLMESDLTNGVVGSSVLTSIDALMAVAGVGTLTSGRPRWVWISCPSSCVRTPPRASYCLPGGYRLPDKYSGDQSKHAQNRARRLTPHFWGWVPRALGYSRFVGLGWVAPPES